MNYRIEIPDIQNQSDPLILEYAERDSISLEWLGGDDPKQLIVGSQLSFTIEVSDARDGAFDMYFTSKEQRYSCKMIDQETDEIIWQGYLLPESYSEPYRGAIFYVNFDATDGLGLLKGKKIPDEYYENEYSVIEYIRQVIILTGLDLPIYFSPAITNSNENNWDEIYLDGLDFVDDGDKLDAYDILEQILNSLRCQIYQAENRWYIEGFNKRQLINQEFKIYRLSNNNFGVVNEEKNLKELTYLPTPNITMLPAVGQINISQEYEPLDTKDNLNTDKDNEWNVNAAQVEPYWYSESFSINKSFRPQIRKPENKLVTIHEDGFNDAAAKLNFQELIRPFYVKQGQRINFDIDVSQLGNDELSQDVITDEFERNIQNRQKFEILLNSVVISTNIGASQIDDEFLEYSKSGNASTDFDLEIDQDGILQFRIYMPTNEIVWDSANEFTTEYNGTIWNKLKITNVGRENKIQVSKTNNEFSSITSDINLDFADNTLLTNKSFRLSKQREVNNSNNRLWFKIISYNLYEGNLYAQVPIRCAVLAKRYQNINFTLMHVDADNSNTGEFINGNDIIFNWLGGETHVINLGNLTSFADGHILIDAKRFKEPSSDRHKWQQWSDDVAQSRNKRYADVVANIEEKLFLEPNYKIEAETDKPLKYNDVIRFRYKDIDRYFTPTNCSWFPDSGTSNVTLQEMKYNGRRAIELNSFVDAGPDRFLPSINSPNSGQLYYDSSNISTPSGTVNNIEFIAISADGNFSISPDINNGDTFFNDMDGDNYEFELKVTDSNGNVASDTFKIIRQAEKNVELEFLPSESFYDQFDNGTTNTITREDIYNLEFNPALQNVKISNIVFDVRLQSSFNVTVEPAQGEEAILDAFANLQIFKNNKLIYKWERTVDDLQNDEFKLEKINNVIQKRNLANNTDNIKLKQKVIFSIRLANVTDANSKSLFKIKDVNFISDNIKHNEDLLPIINDIKTEPRE